MPAASTQRRLILLAVDAALKTIVEGATILSNPGPGGVYKSTVKTVSRVQHTWTNMRVAPDTCPFIGIMPGPDASQHLQFRNLRRTWTIFLHVFAVAKDGDSKLALMDLIEDDIAAALSASRDLNGGQAATCVTFKETMPDYFDEAELGYLKMTIEVLYWRTVDST